LISAFIEVNKKANQIRKGEFSVSGKAMLYQTMLFFKVFILNSFTYADIDVFK